ncbi:MAG: alpha/beta hydrolase family protein [Pyrinomonadaceae bacterium]
MAHRRPLGKKLFKSLLPILFILVVALVVALGYIVYGISRPPRSAYLVTPQTFEQISGSALKVTDEHWQNRDGTPARGWLLRGVEGAPAVILLHRYGTDRSSLFNLGIKVNEANNFTILWPDLRGHGLNPPVDWTSFGTHEENDVLAALDFLRTLKGANQNRLIGDRVGVFGVELGAYAAMRAASHDPTIKVLVLDSVPRDSNELIDAAVSNDLSLNNKILMSLTRAATRAYFLGHLENKSSCDLANALSAQRVLLLAGLDDGYLRESTKSLGACFPQKGNVELKTDLPLTGFTFPSATGEQGEAYDRPIIDFFVTNLR